MQFFFFRLSFSLFFSLRRMNTFIRTNKWSTHNYNKICHPLAQNGLHSFKTEQKFYDENICRTLEPKTHSIQHGSSTHKHPSKVAARERVWLWTHFFCYFSLFPSERNKIKVKFVWKLFHVLVLLKTSERERDNGRYVCVLSAKRNNVKSARNNRHTHSHTQRLGQRKWMQRKCGAKKIWSEECSQQKEMWSKKRENGQNSGKLWEIAMVVDGWAFSATFILSFCVLLDSLFPLSISCYLSLPLPFSISLINLSESLEFIFKSRTIQIMCTNKFFSSNKQTKRKKINIPKHLEKLKMKFFTSQTDKMINKMTILFSLSHFIYRISNVTIKAFIDVVWTFEPAKRKVFATI